MRVFFPQQRWPRQPQPLCPGMCRGLWGLWQAPTRLSAGWPPGMEASAAAAARGEPAGEGSSSSGLPGLAFPSAFGASKAIKHRAGALAARLPAGPGPITRPRPPITEPGAAPNCMSAVI